MGALSDLTSAVNVVLSDGDEGPANAFASRRYKDSELGRAFARIWQATEHPFCGLDRPELKSMSTE